IYYGILWQTSSFMASDAWCTIPFLTHKKSSLDRVHDVLLQAPKCMKLRTDMMDAEAKGLDERHEMLRERLYKLASGLLSRLEVYWELYREEVDTHYDHGQYFEVSDFTSDPLEWIVTAPDDVDFHDAFAATVIPDFDAAIAMMSGFLTASSLTDQARLAHRKRKAIHCASILEAVNWHNRQGPLSGGDHSIVVALKIVIHVAPSEMQKEKCRELLAEWGKARGVEGIATVWGSLLAGAFAPRFNPWEPTNHFYD
ncbi:MAG: hypothetical protein OHK93_002753, partial [Ramalina farinacea]|nr:hypothetical protein [Ramalina farinacea]